jgi:aminopeptidase N
VQNEGYVWYQKGSLAMYALKDYMGEDVLNAAIRRYLERVRFQNAPYTTADEFVAAIRNAAPAELKPVVDDLLTTITLFDNRAVEADWRPTADGKFAVTLKVTASKLRADGLGAETPVALNDLVDIGVFAGEGRNQRALFLEKRRITAPEMTFDVIVNEQPARAGIDPYNKLIDRQSDDNVVTVAKR